MAAKPCLLCAAVFLYYMLFLRLLYSEVGFTISRQSRSPRSSALTSISAVAIFVATGTLCMSHSRSRLFSTSRVGAVGEVSRKTAAGQFRHMIRGMKFAGLLRVHRKEAFYFQPGGFRYIFACRIGGTQGMFA